jgi:hypothetical protein
MPNGFGGRGMGRGFRGGMGFGFRGDSPPWPYVGMGRGGLPRCGYFLSGAGGAPLGWEYQQPEYTFDAGTSPIPQVTPEQELDFLRQQAEAVSEQLEQIETRMRDLEIEK